MGMTASLLLAVLATMLAADPPKTDADRIQGTWDVSRIELNGRVQPKNKLFPVKVTFDRDKLLARVGKREPEIRGTFKLDQSQSPKAYDVTTPEGSMIRGIYELDGDTLKVCLSAPGDERPMAVTTSSDDGRTLIIYKRAKAPNGRPSEPGA
jgi:uncharacterized protein (TIGR03067 family)